MSLSLWCPISFAFNLGPLNKLKDLRDAFMFHLHVFDNGLLWFTTHQIRQMEHTLSIWKLNLTLVFIASERIIKILRLITLFFPWPLINSLKCVYLINSFGIKRRFFTSPTSILAKPISKTLV